MRVIIQSLLTLLLTACPHKPTASEPKDKPLDSVITYEELQRHDRLEAEKDEKILAEEIRADKFKTEEEKKFAIGFHENLVNRLKSANIAKEVEPNLTSLAYEFIEAADEKKNQEEIFAGIKALMGVAPYPQRFIDELTHLISKYPENVDFYLAKEHVFNANDESDLKRAAILKECMKRATQFQACKKAYDDIVEFYKGDECLSSNMVEDFSVEIGYEQPTRDGFRRIYQGNSRSFYVHKKSLLDRTDFISIQHTRDAKDGIILNLKSKSLQKFRNALKAEKGQNSILAAVGENALVVVRIPYEIPASLALSRPENKKTIFDVVCTKATQIKMPDELK